MKFSVLVAILADEMEDKAIDIARDAGAGAISIINARGISGDAKKTFFGLTYEGAQSVLLLVLERHLSLQILKKITRELDLENDNRGIAFTIPLEHLGGVNQRDIIEFSKNLEDEI